MTPYRRFKGGVSRGPLISSSLRKEECVDLHFFLSEIILCVWMFYLHLCIRSTCVLGVHRSQKRASDLLELELWMVAINQVDAGKISKYSTTICPASIQKYTLNVIQPSGCQEKPTRSDSLFILCTCEHIKRWAQLMLQMELSLLTSKLTIDYPESLNWAMKLQWSF